MCFFRTFHFSLNKDSYWNIDRSGLRKKSSFFVLIFNLGRLEIEISNLAWPAIKQSWFIS